MILIISPIHLRGNSSLFFNILLILPGLQKVSLNREVLCLCIYSSLILMNGNKTCIIISLNLHQLIEFMHVKQPFLSDNSKVKIRLGHSTQELVAYENQTWDRWVRIVFF